MRGAQIRKRGAVAPARGSPRCDFRFFIACTACLPKFPPLFCITCTSLRQPISLLLRPASHTIPPAKIPAPNLDKLPHPAAAGANVAAAAPPFCAACRNNTPDFMQSAQFCRCCFVQMRRGCRRMTCGPLPKAGGPLKSYKIQCHNLYKTAGVLHGFYEFAQKLLH